MQSSRQGGSSSQNRDGRYDDRREKSVPRRFLPNLQDQCDCSRDRAADCAVKQFLSSCHSARHVTTQEREPKPWHYADQEEGRCSHLVFQAFWWDALGQQVDRESDTEDYSKNDRAAYVGKHAEHNCPNADSGAFGRRRAPSRHKRRLVRVLGHSSIRGDRRRFKLCGQLPHDGYCFHAHTDNLAH